MSTWVIVAVVAVVVLLLGFGILVFAAGGFAMALRARRKPRPDVSEPAPMPRSTGGLPPKRSEAQTLPLAQETTEPRGGPAPRPQPTPARPHPTPARPQPTPARPQPTPARATPTPPPPPFTAATKTLPVVDSPRMGVGAAMPIGSGPKPLISLFDTDEMKTEALDRNAMNRYADLLDAMDTGEDRTQLFDEDAISAIQDAVLEDSTSASGIKKPR